MFNLKTLKTISNLDRTISRHFVARDIVAAHPSEINTRTAANSAADMPHHVPEQVPMPILHSNCVLGGNETNNRGKCCDQTTPPRNSFRDDVNGICKHDGCVNAFSTHFRSSCISTFSTHRQSNKTGTMSTVETHDVRSTSASASYQSWSRNLVEISSICNIC